MRRMSFALTTGQVRRQEKTVTRRMGWLFLNPGDLVQPVVKGMGLAKGQKHEKIGGPIRVKSVRRTFIAEVGNGAYADDLAREGFPDMRQAEFIGMFCKANRCKAGDLCTRIEFEYMETNGG